MKEYNFKAYKNNLLAKIKHIAADLNIFSIEFYAVNDHSKTIQVFNSDANLLKDRLTQFIPEQDLRLNNLLPDVSLYSDFIKVSPDPLRSRNSLDFLKMHQINDILTFHKTIGKSERIYVSLATSHTITNIAKYYKQFQKIADYIFDNRQFEVTKTQLIKADFINKECPKSLTKKELQILSFLTKGLNALEISQEKFISKRTVDKHIENIRKKLNVATTSSLIAKYAFWQNNAANLVTC